MQSTHAEFITPLIHDATWDKSCYVIYRSEKHCCSNACFFFIIRLKNNDCICWKVLFCISALKHQIQVRGNTNIIAHDGKNKSVVCSWLWKLNARRRAKCQTWGAVNSLYVTVGTENTEIDWIPMMKQKERILQHIFSSLVLDYSFWLYNKIHCIASLISFFRHMLCAFKSVKEARLYYKKGEILLSTFLTALSFSISRK